MKGLSSLERIILECLGTRTLSYDDIQYQTGLHQNVCFNLIQALLIRGILKTESGFFKINENISPLMMEEINGIDSKLSEALEMMEAVLEQKGQKVFRFQKIAMDPRDEKIFLAMLSNIETFLADSHKKAERSVPMKERKVIFWGVSEMQSLMTQIVRGTL